MADRTAVTELFGSYGAANDTHDLILMESCFTEDATFTLHIAEADSIGPLNPRSAIVQFFGDALGAQTDQRRHVLTNFRYSDETSSSAGVDAYLTLLVSEDGKTEAKSAGRYETGVVLDRDQWRFRSMVLWLDSPF